MLYLGVLLLLLYCVYKYDICGLVHYRKTWYTIILLILIGVAGFSYRLGGDNISYIREFADYHINNGFELNELISYTGRQPLWVLMTIICKSIINEYWFFRLVHSILLNTLFILALRRFSKYEFTTLLFYFVLLYFEFNFQIMRQSIAIGLFLVSVSYFANNKWLSYYIINIISFLFHEAAIITFLVPLMKWIGISIKTILIYFLFAIMGAMLGAKLLDLVYPILLQSFVADKAYVYFSKERDGNITLGLNILLNVIIPYFFIIINIKKANVKTVDYFIIVYGLLYSLGLGLPIIYRFSQFFQVFFYICYVEIFVLISSSVKRRFGLNRAFFYIILVLLFLTYRSRMYFSPYGDTNYPSYVQYYPYSSIFFEQRDPTREALYRFM